MLRKLELVLQQNGYFLMNDNAVPRIWICRKEEKSYALFITNQVFSPEKARNLNQNLYEVLEQYNIVPERILVILVQPTGILTDKVKAMLATLPSAWMISEDTGRIYLFENQSSEYDNLYQLLEQELGETRKKTLKINVVWITGILILLNALCYAWLRSKAVQYDGIYLLRCGAINRTTVLEQHQWYRLFTYMFLHGGKEHLFNNMLALAILGRLVEISTPKWKYILTYIGSGIAAGAFSLLLQRSDVPVVGASGAIFGLVGLLIFIAIKNKGAVQGIRLIQFVLMSALLIVNGMFDPYVDNIAHVFGLLSGIVIGVVLEHKRKLFVLSKK